MERYVIGIDIGGTKCAVILGQIVAREENERFDILKRDCFDTDAPKGPEQVIRRLISGIYEIVASYGLSMDQIKGIGISCGGPLDHAKGIIKNPPNLYGWDDIPIVQIMEGEFHIPTFLQNDANACALAEWKLGAGRESRNIIFLTCGTGMGAGLILNGQLYNGANDMAGEVGHIRLAESGPVGYGKAGSFEGFCSGNGIAQVARIKVLEKLQMGERPVFCPDIGQLDNLTAKMVAQAANEGDELAQDIYEISGHYLGKALAILIDILNPEVIVLGSVYERSGQLLSEAMYRVIEEETLSISRKACRIVPAELGDQIGDYAALSVAIHGAYK